jgi:hypothetical protein
MLSIKDDLFTSKIKMNGKHLMKEFINALGGKVEKFPLWNSFLLCNWNYTYEK